MIHIKITNDGTGDVKIGNYDYEVLINTTVIAKGRVESHDRSHSWQRLVRDLLYIDYKEGSGV